MRKALVAALSALALTACATTTPYQPRAEGRPYGYAEQKIESNRVSLSFRGNSLTEREQVENYLLFRAAEVTLENGFDHFIVTTRDVDPEVRFREVGFPRRSFYSYWYYAPRYGWGPWYDPFFDDPIELRQVTQFEARAEILLGKGPKPADNASAFDAREVQANLAPTIQRPTER